MRMSHDSNLFAIAFLTLTSLMQAQDLPTRLQRGLAAAQKGECESALVDLKAVITANPRAGEALNTIGVCETRLGYLQPALEHLQKAVHLEPDREDFVWDLGEFLVAYRAADAATKVFEEGLKRRPDSERMQFGLAMAFGVEDRLQEAVALLEKLIAAHPGFKPGYVALGVGYEKTGQWQKIIALGKKLRSLDESDPLAWYLVGDGLLGRGKTANDPLAIREAISALKQYLLLNPSSYHTHFLLAKAYEGEGNLEHAISELKQTLRLDPQHESAHYVLALLYRKVGKPELAAKEFEAHERNPRREKQDFHTLLKETH